MTTAATPLASRLEVHFGCARRGDASGAVQTAAEAVAGAFGETLPDMAVVITAGGVAAEAARIVRSAMGPVGITGAVMPRLLTDSGEIADGALVIGIANAEGAASGVAAMSGRDLSEAAQAAARMVLSGWPFRARYPRGIGLAFGRGGAEASAPAFLESWREFVGPKLRTVCSIGGDGPVYGMSSAASRVSVGCLEAPYSTGLGYADGAGVDGSPTASETLLHGAADATLTAIKRLDGRPARLVLVVETLSRRRALGDTARAEWATIRGQLDEGTPCVGWVCERVAAYGRGVQPTSAADALIVLALGDSPRS